MRGRRASRAHPRVGGENVCWVSPPPGLGGLIPAWAGKTSGRDVTSGHGAAHPRVGGENIRGPHPVQALRGSSPRGRGKRGFGGIACVVDRLIPAWAGKTRRNARSGHAHPAHPRVGGENRGQIRITWKTTGSSPRGRGKRHGWTLYSGRSRLIPAWAGKTLRRLAGRLGRQAHPRVGGENAFMGHVG